MDLEGSIRKAQAGDVESYGSVVREFQGCLRAFIASFCPNRDLTDEIAQVTFVWAYEHLNEYRAGTRFYAWLRSIARNRLLAELEELKRRARNRRAYLDYLQAKACRDQLQMEDSEQQTELVDALRSCLDKLPERSRSLIKRRYEGQESLSAIATTLRTSKGVVKVTLFRIRQALKRCVEQLLPGVRGCHENG